MRIYRHGRILDTTHDRLFDQSGTAGVVLPRTATDNYVRPRTPHVNCTTTDHTVSPAGYDDGTQTNRWVSVPPRELPQYVAGTGWQFVNNTAVQTSYNIPSVINQYSARVVIPPPSFPPEGDTPRQWCLDELGNDVSGRTICGAGIRWGDLFWGVGHYRIRCCSPSLEEESACLILALGDSLQYFFPSWVNINTVDITIQRFSSTEARVIAQPIGGGDPFTQTITHTLTHNHPYRAEYYLYQADQGCTPPDPIEPYHIRYLVSPALIYQYEIPIPPEHLHHLMFLQVKTVPDPYTNPYLDIVLEMENRGEMITMEYVYDSETNLWEPKYSITSEMLDGVETATFLVSTNQILERVSVMVGGVVLYYTPAPHQVEYLGVLPIEMEQSAIPNGIIPSGYTVLGIPDYARVLPSGKIGVIPAEYARVLTIHLREESV